VEHDRIEPELANARSGRGAWNLGELLAAGFLIATILLGVAYISAGIVSAGAAIGPNQAEVTLFYATEWVSPYILVFPLAAIGLVWWRLQGRSPAAEPRGEGAGGAVAAGDGYAHLVRARRVALVSAAILVVVVCATIGWVVASFLLIHDGEISGDQTWPSEAETLGNASAALLLSVAGFAALFGLRRTISQELAKELPEELAEETESEDDAPAEVAPVTP